MGRDPAAGGVSAGTAEPTPSGALPTPVHTARCALAAGPAYGRSEVDRLLGACVVPDDVELGEFGGWEIARVELPEAVRPYFGDDGRGEMTQLLLHLPSHDKPEVVMEDSRRELRRHLPILLEARGSVLVTGMGLGCVVRGLLAKPEVRQVDVVEIDRTIIERVGPSLQDDPRVTIYHDDALRFDVAGRRWDYAWHDLWARTSLTLCRDHLTLMHRLRRRAGRQGAWMLDRHVARVIPWCRPIGSRRRQPNRLSS